MGSSVILVEITYFEGTLGGFPVVVVEFTPLGPAVCPVEIPTRVGCVLMGVISKQTALGRPSVISKDTHTHVSSKTNGDPRRVFKRTNMKAQRREFNQNPGIHQP